MQNKTAYKSLIDSQNIFWYNTGYLELMTQMSCNFTMASENSKNRVKYQNINWGNRKI